MSNTTLGNKLPMDEYVKIPMGKTDKHALVSADDYHKISEWKWHLRHGYPVRADRINSKPGNDRTYVQMHKVIMEAKEGEVVDHINGNRCDNRRENLRICTHLENSRNRCKQDKYGQNGCVSQHKGVSIKDGLWIAYIRVNGILKHLGKFEDELKAAQCYNAASLYYFCEFSRLNNVATTEKTWQELSSESREKLYLKKYSSKYLGVSLNKQHKKWIAGFSRNESEGYLGIFNTETEAAFCVDAAIFEEYGNEFPRNFPSEPVTRTVNEIISANSNKTSKYFGVGKTKNNKWRARINIKRHETQIGTFDTEKEAALARDKYIVSNKLERVRLNFK